MRKSIKYSLCVLAITGGFAAGEIGNNIMKPERIDASGGLSTEIRQDLKEGRIESISYARSNGSSFYILHKPLVEREFGDYVACAGVLICSVGVVGSILGLAKDLN